MPPVVLDSQDRVSSDDDSARSAPRPANKRPSKELEPQKKDKKETCKLLEKLGEGSITAQPFEAMQALTFVSTVNFNVSTRKKLARIDSSINASDAGGTRRVRPSQGSGFALDDRKKKSILNPLVAQVFYSTAPAQYQAGKKQITELVWKLLKADGNRRLKNLTDDVAGAVEGTGKKAIESAVRAKLEQLRNKTLEIVFDSTGENTLNPEKLTLVQTCKKLFGSYDIDYSQANLGLIAIWRDKARGKNFAARTLGTKKNKEGESVAAYINNSEWWAKIDELNGSLVTTLLQKEYLKDATCEALYKGMGACTSVEKNCRQESN